MADTEDTQENELTQAADAADTAVDVEEDQDDAQDAMPDEMALLKSRARMMGITFSNNIGLDSLKAKIAEKMAPPAQEEEIEEPEEEEVVTPPAEPAPNVNPNTNDEKLNPLAGDVAGETPARKLTKRERIIKESMYLIRCRVTNLDPKKKDLHGEIITVANRYLGTVKKFIPFGAATDNGFHIPKVLYDELDSRRFVHVKTGRDKQTGQIKVDTSYAKEYSLEVLPQLTPDELAKLAAAQLAASNT